MIKASKPFIEKTVQGKGVKENFKVGVKVYSEADLEPIRKDYLQNVDTKLIARYNAKLKALTENTAISDEEYEEESARLESAIETATKELTNYSKQFYIDNVVYLKNVSITVDGKDILIQDTRDAKPIESLWSTPEECLAVLLDLYLGSFYFRDSLPLAISKAIFGTDVKGEELGN